MEIKIVIQQTEDGSKVVYPINYNEFSNENKKYAFSLKDEAHKADFANAYSLQMNHEFKVYSLISSEIKDYLGRSGSFFAIRVIIPNHKSIDEIHGLLNNIKERYMEYYQNKSMESLSFSDLIEAVEDTTFGNNNNSYVVHGIDKEAFVLRDKSSSLNTYFIQNAVKLVKCLYIFDKEKTEPIVYEQMLPFDEVKQLYRKIEITSNGLLETLKVNDIEINKPKINTFDLITTTTEKVSYKVKSKKEVKVLSSFDNSIILQPEYKQTKQPNPKNKSGNEKAIIITTVFLIFAVLGFLGWIYWDSNPINDVPDTTSPATNVPQIVKKEEDKQITNKVAFEEITNNKLEKRYKITSPKGLESFEFIYNSSWSFINKKGQNIPVDFLKKSIKEILESNKEIKFNDTINKNFITELEKISGKEIPEETKPKVEETVVTKKKTAKTPVTSKSQNNGKSNSDTPSKEKDKDSAPDK